MRCQLRLIRKKHATTADIKKFRDKARGGMSLLDDELAHGEGATQSKDEFLRAIAVIEAGSVRSSGALLAIDMKSLRGADRGKASDDMTSSQNEDGGQTTNNEASAEVLCSCLCE